MLADHYREWATARAAAGGPMRVIEIGGGLGYFAKAFVQGLAAANVAPLASYTMLDRSPSLSDHQRALLGDDPRFRFALGDAQEALPDDCYDLIIANEVVADFDVTQMPGAQLAQSGVANFIAVARRHLVPRGKAYISEYGDRFARPELLDHLDHIEHSVEFGPPSELAYPGTQASLTPLGGLLRPSLRLPC